MAVSTFMLNIQFIYIFLRNVKPATAFFCTAAHSTTQGRKTHLEKSANCLLPHSWANRWSQLASVTVMDRGERTPSHPESTAKFIGWMWHIIICRQWKISLKIFKVWRSYFLISHFLNWEVSKYNYIVTAFNPAFLIFCTRIFFNIFYFEYFLLIYNI